MTWVTWPPAVALLVLPTSSAAVEHCRIRIDHADGSLLVNAKNVTGTLRWGARLGDEVTPVFNAAECITAAGKASRCLLAAGGSPEATTAPDGCVIHLRDNGSTACAAEVRGCAVTPPPLPCPLFPADNVWRADVSAVPLHSLSEAWVDSVGRDTPVHPDFGSGTYGGGTIGIPFTVVPAIQPPVPLTFLYDDESDPGPYPIPALVPVEGGARLGKGRGDSHVIVVEKSSCTLYEVFAARAVHKGESWKAGSGAVWDLGSNALRPATWTSADAAGLPILPGLIRYEEILAGQITHAIRFTTEQTQRAFVWPARHYASSSTDPALPPMGAWARLKAGFDVSGFSPTNQVILNALKQHGMLLADNGSPWFLSGLPDPRWDNDELRELRTLTGDDFEFVDASGLMVDPDSGQTQ